MRYQQIHWYEGMFLRPQQFQAADRFASEQLAASMQWQHAYAYGVQSIQIQPDALAAFSFQVNRLRAVTREGDLIEIANSPLRVNLKDALAKSGTVNVMLGVPQFQAARPNVGAADNALVRYRAHALQVPDENTGVNDTEVHFRDKQVRLLLSTDNIDGYEVLPIARVKRGAGDEALPDLDVDYIPPLLAFNAWDGLSMAIIRSLYDLFGQKMEVLSQRAIDRGQTLASSNPGDLEDLLMLGHVNHGMAVLHGLTFAQGVHPYQVYLELCRLVGLLSIFSAERRVSSQLPAYDHDDLGRVFRWLYRALCELLGSSKKLEYEQRFFIGVERGMQVAIDPKWLHSSWRWYVGVHAENISADNCRELLRPGVLDWKMGSDRQVDLLFKHRMPDVKADEDIRIVPRALPSQQGWIYYAVRREGPAWSDVLATQTLAIRFNERIISNLDRLPNQKRLEVIYRDKRAILEFALFAVPGAET